MFVKQLSVFIENREGRLEQVTEVLGDCDHDGVAEFLEKEWEL